MRGKKSTITGPQSECHNPKPENLGMLAVLIWKVIGRIGIFRAIFAFRRKDVEHSPCEPARLLWQPYRVTVSPKKTIMLTQSSPQIFSISIAGWRTRKRSLNLSLWRLVWSLPILAGLLLGPGCNVAPFPSQDLVWKNDFDRNNLVVHADFAVPRKHRLLDELELRGQDLADLLRIELSDEPIQIYLFGDAERYQKFLRSNHSQFDSRRALFVKTDTSLSVYCLWGDRVAEDLRHEMTHAYLHGVFPSMPLWLDEGLAEYCETPRVANGIHRSHLTLLTQSFKQSNWIPNLERLDLIDQAESLSQLDYAEAWLWVHYLLHSSRENRLLLVEVADQLKSATDTAFVVETIMRHNPQAAHEVLEYLMKLVQQANGGSSE